MSDSKTKTIYIKAIFFAVVTTGNKKYAVESPASRTDVNHIIGEIIDFVYHKDYKNEQDSIVEVIINTINKPVIDEVEEIFWPYPPENILTFENWDDMITSEPEDMKKAEAEVIENIINYLDEINISNKRIVEYGSSHGVLAERIYDISKNVDIIGIDSSAEMIKHSQKSTSGVEYKEYDMFGELVLSGDIVISRALAHFVIGPSSVDLLLGKIKNNNKNNAVYIFHSLKPPLLTSEKLKEFGSVEKMTFKKENYISPFYVVKGNGV